MLRRAKSVDIPFMVKGYEIGLRDGNFSKSSMQINNFFAKTTTHKNVHSYIYENNSAPAGYTVIRKKDDGRHEIMMMFVDPNQQGQGIGKHILQEILSGPMKDSPILCATTQPASKRMMQLLRGLGFERKNETSEGVYWEKRSGASAAPAPAKSAPAAPMAPAPSPRLALPISFLASDSGPGPDSAALEAATTVIPMRVNPYTPPPAPSVLEGTATVVEETAPPQAETTEDSDSVAGHPPPTPQTETVDTPTETASEPLAADISPAPQTESEPFADPAPAPPAIVVNAEAQSAKLPHPPADFSGRASELGYASKREQARQLARELFASLKGQETPPEITPPDQQTIVAEEEDIPVLATLNVVREKMGSLPGVSLPPLNRYSLMEFNKKDLENMNVVELAALSAQLIKLAKDQLAEIDKLKSKSKSRF